MPLAECPRCKKVYNKTLASNVCPKCELNEEEDYEKVRKSLSDNPNQSAEEVAEECEVELETVLRLLDSGRIVTVQANTDIRCGRCGAPAISMSKKLCEACLQKLNAQLAAQQAKIKIPKRRDVEVGRAFNTGGGEESTNVRRAVESRKNLMRRDK